MDVVAENTYIQQFIKIPLVMIRCWYGDTNVQKHRRPNLDNILDAFDDFEWSRRITI